MKRNGITNHNVEKIRSEFNTWLQTSEYKAQLVQLTFLYPLC